ncbi:MAG TPA: cytochrome c peroxidase [Blastocatellia bacterium]|nr:cytochrome c peroxidase [Blastocatellia bacterium]
MRRTLKIKLSLSVGLLFALSALASADGPAPDKFRVDLPPGIPYEVWSYYVPRNNPLTPARVELGRRLFFDARLSVDNTVSCSTCHDPKLAFADGKALPEGVGGRRGTRNSPTIFNAMFNSGQFWDGRAQSLEDQAKLPLIDPNEMGNASHEQVVERVRGLPEYKEAFLNAFGEEATIDLIAKAIASFERTLVSGNSAFDRFNAGDRKAMSDAAQRGLLIFRTKGRCAICHSFNSSFPFFTDQNYRNTGIGVNHPSFMGLTRRALESARNREGADALRKAYVGEGAAELGRFLVTGNSLDIGAFRTPSLRDVELTAPYFHDGSAKTLKDVILFYVKGGNDNPVRDWQLESVDLSEGEQSDLIEFLKALTGDYSRRLVETSGRL